MKKYIATIAPLSRNPVQVKITENEFENTEQLDVIELFPVVGSFEVRGKDNQKRTLFVMPIL